MSDYLKQISQIVSVLRNVPSGDVDELVADAVALYRFEEAETKRSRNRRIPELSWVYEQVCGIVGMSPEAMERTLRKGCLLAHRNHAGVEYFPQRTVAKFVYCHPDMVCVTQENTTTLQMLALKTHFMVRTCRKCGSTAEEKDG